MMKTKQDKKQNKTKCEFGAIHLPAVFYAKWQYLPTGLQQTPNIDSPLIKIHTKIACYKARFLPVLAILNGTCTCGIQQMAAN